MRGGRLAVHVQRAVREAGGGIRRQGGSEQHARIGMMGALGRRSRCGATSTILPRYITATRSAM